MAKIIKSYVVSWSWTDLINDDYLVGFSVAIAATAVTEPNVDGQAIAIKFVRGNYTSVNFDELVLTKDADYKVWVRAETTGGASLWSNSSEFTATDATGVNTVVYQDTINNLDADDIAETGSKKWAGESGADVTDSTNVNAAGAVMNSDYNANTVLVATSDNVPQAITLAEGEILGRGTGEDIRGMSATESRTLLNVANGADVTPSDILRLTTPGGSLVNKAGTATPLAETNIPTLSQSKITNLTTDLGGKIPKTTLTAANTIIVATAADTPAGLSVGTNSIVGRTSSGNIAALGKSDILTMINVEDGADVTDSTNVSNAGAVMNSLYDANTILRATTDNTPAAITISANNLIGRYSTGAIASLSQASVRTMLNIVQTFVTESTSPSSGMNDGDLWLDLATGNLKYYDGESWEFVIGAK